MPGDAIASGNVEPDFARFGHQHRCVDNEQISFLCREYMGKAPLGRKLQHLCAVGPVENPVRVHQPFRLGGLGDFAPPRERRSPLRDLRTALA